MEILSRTLFNGLVQDPFSTKLEENKINAGAQYEDGLVKLNLCIFIPSRRISSHRMKKRRTKVTQIEFSAIPR